MSITVTNNTNIPLPKVPTGNTPVDGNEEEGLFTTGTGSNPPVDNDKNAKDKAVLEAELVKYEAELKSLEAEKAAKQADKKELEAQRKVLNSKKQKIQAEIEANNKLIAQYTDKMAEFDEETQKEQTAIQNLQKQYDAKNKEAQELTQKISEKISKIIEDSNNSVKASREKIQQTTEEAYAKVASGEIEENEVAQYIAQKTGISANANTAAAFSEINALSGQVKSLIAGASSLLTIIGAKQTNVNKIKAQMASGNTAINELNAVNAQKGQELSSVNKEITVVDAEISSINGDIAKIDTKIVKVQTNITETKTAIAGLNDEKTEPIEGDKQPVQKPGSVEKEEIPGSSNNKNNDVVSGGANNPFVAVSFETISYSNIVEALDAIAKNNDIAVQNARTQDDNNKQEMRNMFQDLLKA